MTDRQRNEWKEMCTAFAKKFGYKLLFVNDESCGVEMQDGQFKHIYAEEMAEILRRANNE